MNRAQRAATALYEMKAELALALLTSLNSAHCSPALLKLRLALVEEDTPELNLLFLTILIKHFEAGQDLVEVVADPGIYAREVWLPQCLVKDLLGRTDMIAVLPSRLKVLKHPELRRVHNAT